MGSSICSRNKTLFFRICIGGFRSKKRVFLLSHDSENLRNFDCHDTQWASQYTWGKNYYNNEINMWYLFSRCKHRWHVTSEEIQNAKKHVTEINDLNHKITKQKNKQTRWNIFYSSTCPLLDFFFVLWLPSSSENSSELKFSSKAWKIQQKQELD